MPADPVNPNLSNPNFSEEFRAIQDLVACPACGRELRFESEKLICANCARQYPVIDGIPVLIANSSPQA